MEKHEARGIVLEEQEGEVGQQSARGSYYLCDVVQLQQFFFFDIEALQRAGLEITGAADAALTILNRGK